MNYSSYLQLDQLLALQQPASPVSEHRNENLFIITHQTYELWFRQLIEELHYLIDKVEEGEFPLAIDVLQRVNTIVRAVVNQICVICTLKYHEFQRFRSYLGTASGFQSWQLDSIEALLGKANDRKLQQYYENTDIWQKLAVIIRPVSLWQAVKNHLLDCTDCSGMPTENLREVIKASLERPSCESLLLNQLFDLDSLLQEWRFRHLKLVERTIGKRKGTGKSSGADYLKSTIFVPVFEELWEAIN